MRRSASSDGTRNWCTLAVVGRLLVAVEKLVESTVEGLRTVLDGRGRVHFRAGVGSSHGTPGGWAREQDRF
ncbi:MAG: hypothetical protein BRD43_03475 [Bacteroidetes bacterium QS_4_64_154]|nr:MAG: hypothetical protein BRD43_03475 [Bacteroidetes bacterium QS_4_64_154]